MATGREKEILQAIRQNPLISQQELADRCKITRSSVGVHISNLMKKGLIQGKGYILTEKPYTAVVGGASLDIWGTPFAPLIGQDSTPGKVGSSPGGVGRNIAHNLALMGEEVMFISVFGDDPNAQPLLDSCYKAGVDLSHAPIIPGGTTSVYLFITNPGGEMQLAVSDNELYNSITPAFLQKRMGHINRAALCIADTNLPEAALQYLAESCTVPLFVDTVSTTKARKIKPLLPFIHTLKPNRIEAELLSGIEIKNDDSLKQAAERLLAKGVMQVFITLGADGVFCANAGEQVKLPVYPAEVVNTTGAGDSFMAALAWAHLQGFSLAQSGRAGLAAASIALAARETISPCVSPENLLRIVADK